MAEDDHIAVRTLHIRASKFLSHAMMRGYTNDEDILIIVPETIDLEFLDQALLTFVRNRQKSPPILNEVTA